jgi:hypothetical protein
MVGNCALKNEGGAQYFGGFTEDHSESAQKYTANSRHSRLDKDAESLHKKLYKHAIT